MEGIEKHQTVIDELTVHVLYEELSKERAEELIRSVEKGYPSGSQGQAQAILWHIRKDHGLPERNTVLG